MGETPHGESRNSADRFPPYDGHGMSSHRTPATLSAHRNDGLALTLAEPLPPPLPTAVKRVRLKRCLPAKASAPFSSRNEGTTAPKKPKDSVRTPGERNFAAGRQCAVGRVPRTTAILIPSNDCNGWPAESKRRCGEQMTPESPSSGPMLPRNFHAIGSACSFALPGYLTGLLSFSN